MTKKKESLEEFMEILSNVKGEYKRPIKMWLWGKAITEWFGIFIGAFLLILFTLLAIRF
jgi:tetrahydromethanopterin S-methyltransferase subunit G